MNIDSVCPGGDELVAAVRPLLGGHRVADVVLPHPVDLEVPHGDALVAQVELLDDRGGSAALRGMIAICRRWRPSCSNPKRSTSTTDSGM